MSIIFVLQKFPLNKGGQGVVLRSFSAHSRQPLSPFAKGELPLSHFKLRNRRDRALG